jgi:hypothetical protein
MMNDDFTFLRTNLLNQKAIKVQIGGVLILKESANDRNYTIEIAKVPENTLAIKTDLFPPPKKFLNCGGGICKRADYVILNTDEIIFIELKSGKSQTSQVIKQLKGSQSVIKYLFSIAEFFYDRKKFFSKAQLKQYFVSIYFSSTCNKRLTRPEKREKKSFTNNIPEKMLKIRGEHFKYQDLKNQ